MIYTIFIYISICVIHYSICQEPEPEPEPESEPEPDSVTTASASKFPISRIEVFHIYASLIACLWVLLALMIMYGIYQRIPSYKSIKSIFVGGKTELLSHAYTMTIIACEPSPSYDYDNSSIRIDLVDKKDELIASLLMKPLTALNSIQPNTAMNPITQTIVSNKNDGSVPALSKLPQETPLQKNNLSRQVPMIGIFKLISGQTLRKIHTICIGHDCPDHNASILLRCVEISNMNSLVCHTYPLNAFIKHLSNPYTVTFESQTSGINTETVTEFDDSHDLPRKIKIQQNSELNLIESSAFWLLCFNIIILCSYVWSDENAYKSNKEWLMWSEAFPVSLVMGSIVAVIYILIATPYRLFKEYYLFKSTHAVVIIKCSIISLILMAAIIFATSSLVLGNESINMRLLVQWYRLTLLSSLVFIVLSVAFTMISLFMHISPKKSGASSIRKMTLYIPEEGENRKTYKMITLDCNIIEIKNLPNLTVFSSAWVKAALIQHKGLDRAILCDVYEVALLPQGTVITNLAQNAAKLFGRNISHKSGAEYATKVMEQRGMARSVSQYGNKKNKLKKDVVLDIDSSTGSLLASKENAPKKKPKSNK